MPVVFWFLLLSNNKIPHKTHNNIPILCKLRYLYKNTYDKLFFIFYLKLFNQSKMINNCLKIKFFVNLYTYKI